MNDDDFVPTPVINNLSELPPRIVMLQVENYEVQLMFQLLHADRTLSDFLQNARYDIFTSIMLFDATYILDQFGVDSIADIESIIKEKHHRLIVGALHMLDPCKNSTFVVVDHEDKEYESSMVMCFITGSKLSVERMRRCFSLHSELSDAFNYYEKTEASGLLVEGLCATKEV